MKFIKPLVIVLLCLIAGLAFKGVQRLRSERVMLDHLLGAFENVKRHIPEKASVYYFSNYSNDFGAAYYFQSQFAMAPHILMQGDTSALKPGDYVVLVNSSDPAVAGDPKHLALRNPDTLYTQTVAEKQFILQVYKLK